MSGRNRVPLSSRLRPDVECAPWVIQEVRKLEGALEAAASRQARSRQARAEAGGKQVAVWLTPAAVKRLAALQAQGESIAGAINRLLVESR